MKKKIIWVVVSLLVVLALLAASCAKAEEKAPAPAAKEAAPVVKEAAPVVKEVAPAVKEAVTPAEEKPRYGGQLIRGRGGVILSWDEKIQPMWMMQTVLGLTNEELLTGKWENGPAGTGHTTFTGIGTWWTMDDVASQLAESWELTDPETIVFHLRKGVHYALDPGSAASRLVNGRELVADDVVFSIKRIYFDPNTVMYSIAGVARPLDIYAPDKYTVVVKAAKGLTGATLEYVSEWTKVIPPEVIKKYGDMNQWETVVGTGPFIMTDYVAMSSVTWVRNPNYWGTNPVGPGKGDQLPYLDGVKTLIIPDMSTLMAAIRTGRIDLYEGTFNWTDVKQLLQTAPWLNLVSFGRDSYDVLVGRVDKPELPFKDIKVRRALQMGINCQEILDTYYEGKGDLLTFLAYAIPEAKDCYTPVEQLPPETRELFTYNPEKAKRLLTEAGYPNGFTTEIIVPAADVRGMDLVTIVKAYWSKIGINLEMIPKEAAVYQSIRNKRTYSQMFKATQTGVPFGMYCVRHESAYNYPYLDDPKIEAYYARVAAAHPFDPPTRNQVFKEMNLYTLSQAWYYITPTSTLYIVWPPWVKNYHGEYSIGIYNNAPINQYLWLDRDLKKSMGY